jgi:hypothetical protein
MGKTRKIQGIKKGKESLEWAFYFFETPHQQQRKYYDT